MQWALYNNANTWGLFADAATAFKDKSPIAVVTLVNSKTYRYTTFESGRPWAHAPTLQEAQDKALQAARAEMPKRLASERQRLAALQNHIDKLVGLCGVLGVPEDKP